MDTDLRTLERAAATGDASAVRALARLREAVVDEQDHALARLHSGRSVFLTGAGGTGKSFVLRRWLTDCETAGRRVAVTASTGAAALQIGGTTLHRAVGLGVDMGWERSSRRGGWRFQAEELRDLDAIVIDEVSMIDGATLTDAEALCTLARLESHAYGPWGGLQVVLVGDLGQLPPVEAQRRGFPFEGEGWTRLEPEIVELRRVRRQEDKAFAELLGRLRLGHLSRADLQVLADRVNAFDPNTGLRLAPRRVDVDAANEAALDALPGEAVLFQSVDTGTIAAIEQLERDCMAPRRLKLKVGARVIAVQNDQVMRWANGSQGTVASFERGGVTVAFDRGGAHWVGPSLFPLRERKNGSVVVRAHREQIPLRLGYAVTIHKSQGMSLDRVSVNLDGSFERGLAYVALSRVRSLEGLNLESRRMGSLEAHPKFLRFVRERGLS